MLALANIKGVKKMTVESNVFSIDLAQIFPTGTFALLDANPIYEYLDGKRTTTVIGTRYSVADKETFKNFDVKVKEPKETIDKTMISNAGQRIWVSFTNAKVMPYSMKYGKCDCTVKADAIKVIK